MRAGVHWLWPGLNMKTQSFESNVSSAFLNVIFLPISVRWRALAEAGLKIKTQYVEDVVSSALLDVSIFSINVRWRWLALAWLNIKRQYISIHRRRRFNCISACGIFSHRCAQAFNGFGLVEYKNTIHRRRRFKCIYACDSSFQSMCPGVHWICLGWI